MKRLRILLADDHALFRDGIASLLRAFQLELVGEASDGAEAVEQALALRPDVILMDIQMPRLTGIAATERIKRELPDVKIVMLTMSEDEDDLLDAIRAGADGYLLKNLTGDAFIEMLRGLTEGTTPVSQSMTGKLLRGFSRSMRPPQPAEPPSLSEREIEVLRHVARGEISRQIAEALYISENTVNFHVRNIMEKLHARTRSEAVARAIRDGLVAPDPDD